MGSGNAALWLNAPGATTSPVFTTALTWPSPTITPLLVDVNSDGYLDFPAAGFIAPLGLLTGQSAAVVTASLYVRMLGRNGAMNQHGGTVCLVARTPQAPLTRTTACRVVDTGGGAVSGQSPYDVHIGVNVGVGSSVVGVDVIARFVTGHVHNATTMAGLANVSVFALPAATSSSSPSVLPPTIVIRDVPAIVAVTVAPTAGLLPVGSTLTVTLTAAWRETGLLPSPSRCCFINGVNVSGSFRDVGDGVYSLTYRVAAGDGDVVQARPQLLAVLADGQYRTVVTDAIMDAAFGAVSYSGLSIDASPPVVTLACIDWNNTVQLTTQQALCASCGTVTNEST